MAPRLESPGESSETLFLSTGYTLTSCPCANFSGGWEWLAGVGCTTQCDVSVARGKAKWVAPMSRSAPNIMMLQNKVCSLEQATEFSDSTVSGLSRFAHEPFTSARGVVARARGTQCQEQTADGLPHREGGVHRSCARRGRRFGWKMRAAVDILPQIKQGDSSDR